MKQLQWVLGDGGGPEPAEGGQGAQRRARAEEGWEDKSENSVAVFPVLSMGGPG